MSHILYILTCTLHKKNTTRRKGNMIQISFVLPKLRRACLTCSHATTQIHRGGSRSNTHKINNNKTQLLFLSHNLQSTIQSFCSMKYSQKHCAVYMYLDHLKHVRPFFLVDYQIPPLASTNTTNLNLKVYLGQHNYVNASHNVPCLC